MQIKLGNKLLSISSWDLLRFAGAVLMGGLTGWVLADTYLKFIK